MFLKWSEMCVCMYVGLGMRNGKFVCVFGDMC